MESDKTSKTDLTIPLKLCVNKQCRLRFSGDSTNGDLNVWLKRQEDWRSFWRLKGGKENLVPGGKVSTNGTLDALTFGKRLIFLSRTILGGSYHA